MDIELLKELIPLLTSAGEATFWLILLVILQGYFTGLLWTTGVLGCIYMAVRLVMTARFSAQVAEAGDFSRGDFGGIRSARDRQYVLKLVREARKDA